MAPILTSWAVGRHANVDWRSYYLPPEPATSFGVVNLEVPERLAAQLFPPRA